MNNGFNLVSERWISVLPPDGGIKDVSLCEFFENAHEYVDLAGETPTLNAALLRFLLAIVHTVFYRYDVDGKAQPADEPDIALDRWQELWKMKKFPAAPIVSYLEAHRDEFDLFDEKRPFLQTPSLTSVAKKQKDDVKWISAAKLNGEVFEGGNKISMFSPRNGIPKNTLSFAEAARWLIHIIGYDDCALKKTNELKAYETNPDESPGEGWIGKLGLVYAVGGNMFETIMLNYVALKNGSEETWKAPAPLWERNSGEYVYRKKVAIPDNQAYLLLFPSRQLLLKRNGDAVDGFYIIWGSYFDRGADSEQMTMRVGIREKDDLSPYTPRKHDRSKFMWQEFASIFTAGEKDFRPGVVQWLAFLKMSDIAILDNTYYLCFRAVGIDYKTSQKSSVDDIMFDALSIHAGLLSDLGVRWQNTITNEVKRCDELANAAGYMAQSIENAAGDRNNSEAGKAREQMYFRLDKPFRKWLSSINPDDAENDDALINEWHETALATAREYAAEMILNAGIPAFTGRVASIKSKGANESRRYSAPKAYGQFLAKIKTIYTNKEG